MNLVLLEDEPILCEELAEYLGENGHDVTVAKSIAEFRQAFIPAVHRIVIIDLGLPDGDGTDLIKQLRAARQRVGIIVLTARNTTHDKVSGLIDGADHYLSKLADLDELNATVAALGRRLVADTLPCWILQAAPRQLIPPGFPPIPLSGQDYVVLLALASGGDVSRQSIVSALGERFLDYDQRRMDTQMRRLRRKVEQACGLELPVTTLRNIGYRFHDPIELRN
ncbi:response regulator transcription factor [Silvimonas soli]|uniref:response regulator transcription factor n=1 Tax=Silvimonas soli TaxID=2980100 RepID=UPI0024B324DF|nr:response regulator transcription factor [Silvimonas soli]